MAQTGSAGSPIPCWCRFHQEKLAGSRHLRDLIGYIEHRYPDHQPDASRVVSVFDLLYSEYDDVLRSLAGRLPGRAGSPAEQIVDTVLEGVLSEPEYAHLRVESQMLLRNLVPDPDALRRRSARVRPADVLDRLRHLQPHHPTAGSRNRGGRVQLP
jgi:hypothetical protein